MRSVWLPAVLTAFLCPASANAQEPVAGDSSCPISTLAAPVRYERLHQVPTRPAHDDVSHKMVTPGGMVLDTPRMVAVMDVLTIAARDHTAVCFSLLTFARERRKCEFTGIARNEVGDAFLFGDGDVVVRFTFIGDDQVRVAPIGDGYRKRCESSGEIQPAIYTRKPSAG